MPGRRALVLARSGRRPSAALGDGRRRPPGATRSRTLDSGRSRSRPGLERDQPVDPHPGTEVVVLRGGKFPRGGPVRAPLSADRFRFCCRAGPARSARVPKPTDSPPSQFHNSDDVERPSAAEWGSGDVGGSGRGRVGTVARLRGASRREAGGRQGSRRTIPSSARTASRFSTCSHGSPRIPIGLPRLDPGARLDQGLHQHPGPPGLDTEQLVLRSRRRRSSGQRRSGPTPPTSHAASTPSSESAATSGIRSTRGNGLSLTPRWPGPRSPVRGKQRCPG